MNNDNSWLQSMYDNNNDDGDDDRLAPMLSILNDCFQSITC